MVMLRWVAPAMLVLTTSALGQDLPGRVAAVGTGTVRLSFAARPGVCGGSGGSVRIIDNRDDADEWVSDCESGPVRVALTVRDRRVTGVRTHVGGRWRAGTGVTDLGNVRPQEAAGFLLGLAEQGGPAAEDAILPAALADSVVIWPRLLRLARTPSVPTDVRRDAVFWLGQAAEAAVVPALDSIVADPRGEREIRKHAVFALSQRPPDESVPALIHVARTHPDPELRRTALFWLAQSEDPRALAVFEEILR
jgi:HEAT repeats